MDSERLLTISEAAVIPAVATMVPAGREQRVVGTKAG